MVEWEAYHLQHLSLLVATLLLLVSLSGKNRLGAHRSDEFSDFHLPGPREAVNLSYLFESHCLSPSIVQLWFVDIHQVCVFASGGHSKPVIGSISEAKGAGARRKSKSTTSLCCKASSEAITSCFFCTRQVFPSCHFVLIENLILLSLSLV